MNLEIGWYKVKLKGEWICAKWGGTHWEYLDFRIMHEDFDQIGDRIEFPE